MSSIYIPVGCDLVPWLKDGDVFGYDEDLRAITLDALADLDTYAEVIACMKPCWFWQLTGWDKTADPDCEGGAGAECDENGGKLPDACRSTLHSACGDCISYGYGGGASEPWSHDCDYPFGSLGINGILWGGGCHDDASNANVELSAYHPCDWEQWIDCFGEDDGFILHFSLEGIPLDWLHYFPLGTSLGAILSPWCQQSLAWSEFPDCYPEPSSPDYSVCYDPVPKLNLF